MEAQREVHGLEDIAEYLRNIKFSRKLFGGCDTQDVLRHLNEITCMYNALLFKQNQDFEQELTLLKREDIRVKQVCSSLIKEVLVLNEKVKQFELAAQTDHRIWQNNIRDTGA